MGNLPVDQLPEGGNFPFVECWLQWIPNTTLKHTAACYILHAVSYHKKIKFGDALQKMLMANSCLHKTSIARKSNCRKVDPLAGLKFQESKCMSVQSRTDTPVHNVSHPS